MQDNISFATQDQLDAGEDELTAVTEGDLTELERAAVIEIVNHLDVAHVTVTGRDYERILTVERQDGTQAAMPYEHMYIYSSGKIADAMTNHPVSHRTFREMVEDHRANLSACR